MPKRLSDLKPGEKAFIIKLDECSVLKKRLMELGIREGKEVFMRRDAPMGDPMEISVLGFNLSLRKSEAQCVQIESVEN